MALDSLRKPTGTTMAANIWFHNVIFFLPITLSVLLIPSAMANKQTYIIHMNHHSKPNSFPTHHEWYQSLTSSADSILYAYTTAFHGFAAYLDPEEAESLRELDAVVNVFEDKLYTPQTTRTPQFLGINSNFGLIEGGEFQAIEQAAEDVIVGVLDTGIWPESKSFDDTGLPPIPKRWKGTCKSTKDFDHKLCNRKLIGSRYFMKASEKKGSKDIISGRDYEGHGTHTASTVAGSPVANASLFGYGKGSARGMAVRARIASYKVCWSTGCSGADILAGLVQAVLDGVDILSLSLGISNIEQVPYIMDPIAIGGFGAIQEGVFVSAAAGNNGPTKSSVANAAPWILTVAAGTIDRDFPAYAFLGKKKRLTGVSLYSGPGFGSKPAGLVYHQGRNSSRNFCLKGTLEPALVRGKVVVCDGGIIKGPEAGVNVANAGGVGMIYVIPMAKALISDVHLVPTVVVGKAEGDLVKKYIKTVTKPTVLLSFGGTVVGVRPTPILAWFSSRGPNGVTPEILKPDIMAPGVNIVAAFSQGTSASGLSLKLDNRITEYSIISGTSMACPHASGIAALLKAAYPNWSASAIKSAIMTTAFSFDNTFSPFTDSANDESSNPWGYGSGHIDPKKALSPGLVYDISNEDYLTFLCSLNYPLEILKVFDPNFTCPTKFSDLGELNYPSFSVVFRNKTVVKYIRELTNVGVAGSTYKVGVAAPPSVAVTVEPTQLVFKNVGDKHKYTITFKAKNAKPAIGAAFGSIVWRNARYTVGSPIAFTWA